MSDAQPDIDRGANGAGRAPPTDPESNLPATVAEARLPATYEAARIAIAQCERIDECRTWSDKAAALASYARLANDDSLRVMAVRIQARAERRAGELLRQIEPSKGGRPKTGDGTDPSSRKAAANAAGLSERQRKTASRIAVIPEAEFNRQVEGPSPPTITALAQQGKATRAGAVPTPRDWKACDALVQLRGESVDQAEPHGDSEADRVRQPCESVWRAPGGDRPGVREPRRRRAAVRTLVRQAFSVHRATR